jgi:hypothetical protein|tara:strand:+ start:419 stop:1597 length:1179 start_codon:yes stop_codon:yes gene_type:complete
MAYNVIPKTEPEMRAQSRHMTAADEVIRLYSYLTEQVPSVTDPIAMDPKQKSKLKILRELKGYMTINDMVNGAKLDRLKLDHTSWGNGSRGGGGSFNKGAAFERELAKNINEWVETSELPKNKMYADLIENIIEAHGLEDCKQIGVEMVGEKDTKRPLSWSNGWFVGDAGKGNYDIGQKVSDVTITLDCIDGSTREVYLSAKTTGTVALSNLGTKTNVFPDADILKDTQNSASRFPTAGEKLLKTFGIDEDDFVKIFREAREMHECGGEIKSGKVVNNPSYDGQLLSDLIKGCLGHGYHYCHLNGGKIKEFNVTKDINRATSVVSSVVIYYGGKTGKGQRVDMVVDTGTMELKFNVRDTSGKGRGFPDKFQAGYKFKDEADWSWGDGEDQDG